MKKIFSGVLLVLIATHLQAQTGLYIKAGLGFAVPLAGQTIAVDGTPFNGSINYEAGGVTASTYDVKKASFATGAQAGIGIGYMFTTHLGVELDINAIVSPKSYRSDDSNALNPNSSAADAFILHITRQATLPFLITPSLVYSTDGGSKRLSGYARGGIVLPLGIKITEEYSAVYNYGGNDYKKLETISKFGAGFSGAMGVKYKVAGNISVWAEANIMAMSVYAKQSKVVEHSLDGAPAPSLPTIGTVIKYSSNGSYNFISGSSTVSTNMPVYSIPFSNLGVAIGVSVALQKQKAESTEHHQK